jgi:hypothetical protein
MTEEARRQRTERLLTSRLEELAGTLERGGADGPAMERRLELASAATDRAIELRLLDGRRAAAIWADAARRHPVLAA